MRGSTSLSGVAVLTLAVTLTACGSRGQAAVSPAPTGADRAGPGDYEDAVPDGADTREGVFRTHFGEDGTLVFEIPEAELGREMLLLNHTASEPGGAGSPGTDLIVEWRRQGDRIVLREKNYEQRADSSSAIWRAVSGMMEGPIIATFEIEATSPEGHAVIDVTSLFTDTHEVIGSLEDVDEDASWIERVAAFPRNVEVTVTQTGEEGDEPTTQLKHWSIMRLPTDPARPRLADDRVGFREITFVDYSAPEHRSEERRFINRHRLVKANPNAEVSDPVEPIIYWIDPATPEWLQPWIVSGVDAWQPAFEEAGFTNAIFGRVAPTPEEDPNFSLDDARYSVIYWRPSTTQNANGGRVVDPRTGETLRGRVQMYHNVMNLVRNWYFTQVSPLDERARSLPMPDSLMGKLVEYVVAHEIGHSIGYPHNMKASAMYPVDSIRSETFLRGMNGHVSTLMDYSRFNYVAQPEDGIPPELLIPQIGPYDKFAVKWGYAEIPGARTPEDELPTLDRWARMQDTIPWLRYTTETSPNDPYALTEAVGDEDAVQSSMLGLRNLERVTASLLQVAERPGESYDLLDELYGNVVSQWGRYNGHVAAIVGGAYTQERYGTGERFRPVERERQREAVQFLNTNVFDVPEWLLNDAILRRIEAEGVVDRVRTQQVRILEALLSEERLNRLIEYSAFGTPAAGAYSLADLTQDLRGGVWRELQAGSGSVSVDVYRRNLQRAYVDMLAERLTPPEVVVIAEDVEAPEPLLSDVRPVLRGEARWLRDRLRNAVPRAANEMTRLHLLDLQTEIDRLIDG